MQRRGKYSEAKRIITDDDTKLLIWENVRIDKEEISLR